MKIGLARYLVVLYCFVFSHVGLAQFMNIDSAVSVLKTLKDDTNKVILLDHIAWDISYQNLQKGIEYSDQSLKLAKKLNFEEFYSKIFNTQGAIYDDMAERAKALNFYLEGLKYAKKYNQIQEMGIIHNSMGNLYSKRDEFQKALSHYIKSVDIARQFKKDMYLVYGNIASIYVHYKKLDSAVYYLNICMAHHLKTNNELRLMNNYMLLSEIQYEQKDAKNSLISAKKSIELGEKLNDRYTLAHAYLQLGLAYALGDKMQEGIVALNKSIAIATETGDIPTLEKTSEFLSEFYEQLGDYKNSLLNFKKFGIYKDSSLNKESIRQVKNAEAKFENEKKQKEIELLGEKQKLNETENQKKKIYLYAAVFGILILGLVLVILYRNNVLKQKTNKNLEAFNTEVNHQKVLVDVKNKEITDSINYAKRIQQSILTSDHYFKNHTTDFFILFKPKDIVSGDFYWALNHDNRFIVMTADCTGHGVPGAMMSMMGINFLNEIVNEKGISSPASILNQLRSDIIKALNPEGSTVETKDGMDCCLCSFDFKNMKLTYSNANNNFYIIRNSQLIISQSNKMPVGAGHGVNKQFEEFVIDIEKGDLVITLTDGYADQFGGQKGKKYKYKQLEQLLLANAHQPLSELKKELDDKIEVWKGDLEQVDDICIVGIKV
ncbi:MAG: SpoIIE family protein phosphatase [Bacteroidota bacterium]